MISEMNTVGSKPTVLLHINVIFFASLQAIIMSDESVIFA